MEEGVMENPMQPIVQEGDDRPRFKANQIVRYLLDNGGLDLNRLAAVCHDMPQTDWEQFYQLIGYSVSGYNELNMVSDESANRASDRARRQMPEFRGCREDGCAFHAGVRKER